MIIKEDLTAVLPPKESSIGAASEAQDTSSRESVQNIVI